MEGLNELTEALVERRFARKAYRRVFWSQGFSVFSSISLRVIRVPAENAFLGLDTLPNDFFRVIPRRKGHFIPLDVKIFGLGSPAKDAFLSAIVYSWSHLDALVSLYAIELLFIARSAVDDCLIEPSAPFYGRVSAYEVVFLSLQDIDKHFGSSGRFHVTFFRQT